MGEMPALCRHFQGSTRSPLSRQGRDGLEARIWAPRAKQNKKNKTKPQMLSIWHQSGPFGGLGESGGPEAPTVVGERTAFARAAQRALCPEELHVGCVSPRGDGTRAGVG